MAEPKNKALYDRLRAAADRGALHHALLLTGPKGSGKGELARFIAAAMECTAPAGKPCGTCPACRKVFSGIHPDVIAVRDEGHKTLPVDTVRALCADAYIRPNEGQRKIYIFEDCGQLDSRCQDILLKTVEEGPRYAAFLFLSENAAAILPTCIPTGSAPIPVRQQAPAALPPHSFRSRIRRQRTRIRLFWTSIRACLQILTRSRMAILPWKSTSSSTIL